MNRRLQRKQDKDAVIHGQKLLTELQDAYIKALVELLVKEHEAFNPFAVKVEKT